MPGQNARGPQQGFPTAGGFGAQNGPMPPGRPAPQNGQFPQNGRPQYGPGQPEGYPPGQPGRFPGGPPPQFPAGQQPPGPPPPGNGQFAATAQFGGTAQFDGTAHADQTQFLGPAQPGFDQRSGPGQPGWGPGPGPGVRRRITDAFARLGSLTPAAGFGSMRRGGGAGPAEAVSGDPFAADYNTGDFIADDVSADDFASDGADQGAPVAAGRAENAPRQAARGNKALVVGAGVLAVVAVGAVIVTPRLLGPSDPGCKAYSGAALTAYNKAIHDLNSQAPTTELSPDMTTAITDLTGAVAQAKSASVKSALDALLGDLKTVQSDIAAGSVPTSMVNSLNAASITADHAC